jgi:hypothetical protein
MKCFLLYCGFIIATAAIAFAARAQVVSSYIEVQPSTIQPDCHTYTGCSVIVAQPYSIVHYYHYHHRHHQAHHVLYPNRCRKCC